LGQLKLQLSALDPLGLPLSSAILEGSQADDPLYVPEIKKVQSILGRHGLLYIGDSKMGSLATRAHIATSGDYYCTPLSKVQLDMEELRELLTPIWQGGQENLVPIERTNEQGEKEVIAEGFEKKRSQEMKESKTSTKTLWEERLLIVPVARNLSLALRRLYRL
jgi:transposase